MKVTEPIQVAITVYYSTLKSLEIMCQCKEQGIDKHPSIASEHIKCISHNQPYELVESMDKNSRTSKIKQKIMFRIFPLLPNNLILPLKRWKILSLNFPLSKLELGSWRNKSSH